jgi:hypothetical protein
MRGHHLSAAVASIILGIVMVAVGHGAVSAWNRGSLPAAIRDRIRPTASVVPAFPLADKRLMRAQDWPDSMTIGGVLCVRRIHAWEDDDAIALESLDHAESGLRLMLFYDHPGSRWDFANAGWGPRYSWNEGKRLTQRIWYEPDSARLVTHDYTYYRNGRLLGYSWRSEPRRQAYDRPKTYEFLSQFYDEDGRLIALGFEKMRPGSRDSVYAWMGSVVPYHEFRMKMHVLYEKAHPGDR